ncbi:MAG TPA: hypothetical protein VG204_03350 [Terriglobia bacterium]|nr:hypothetical protein [Terriglobia bacterium]
MLVFASVAVLVIMFVAIFGGIVYWIIVSQKGRRAEKQELTLGLGFHPVEESGGGLASEIIRLHGRGFHQRLQVRNLCKRGEGECDVYLFDLWDSSSASTDPLAENGVAVVSGRLNLTRFSIFPKVPGSGKLASAANRLWRRLEAGDQATIPVGDGSRFNQEYFLAGDIEGAVRKAMTDEVLERIGAKLYRQIEGDRNMFTYDRIILDPSAQNSKEIQVQERVAEALEVFGLLRSSG